MKFGSVMFLVVFTSCINAQQRPAPDVRAELTKIDLMQFRDLDDYVARSGKVRIILPRLEEFYAQSAHTIARIKREHPDDKNLVTLADFVLALNTKDQEGFHLLSHEMTLALQMSKLPKSDRPGFFNERIAPLEREELHISEEEVQMAIEGRNRGLPLPDDVLQSLSSRK